MAITESRIKAIEDRIDELTQNFLQTQRNQVPITARTDENANQIVTLDNNVKELEPWTATQHASCGDTEIIFENVPSGAMTVIILDSEDNYIDYSLERAGNTVTVYCEPLEYAADVTITVI